MLIQLPLTLTIKMCSNRPSLSENVNSTQGILRVVVTGNFNVYRPDTLRTRDLFLSLFFCLFVYNFILLIVKGNVKNFFINTTRSAIASRSLSHLHLNSHSRHLCHHAPWVMSSRPTRESPSAPLNPFQPRDAIGHHAFHLFLIYMPFAHWLQ